MESSNFLFDEPVFKEVTIDLEESFGRMSDEDIKNIRYGLAKVTMELEKITHERQEKSMKYLIITELTFAIQLGGPIDMDARQLTRDRIRAIKFMKDVTPIVLFQGKEDLRDDVKTFLKLNLLHPSSGMVIHYEHVDDIMVALHKNYPDYKILFHEVHSDAAKEACTIWNDVCSVPQILKQKEVSIDPYSYFEIASELRTDVGYWRRHSGNIINDRMEYVVTSYKVNTPSPYSEHDDLALSEIDYNILPENYDINIILPLHLTSYGISRLRHYEFSSWTTLSIIINEGLSVYNIPDDEFALHAATRKFHSLNHCSGVDEGLAYAISALTTRASMDNTVRNYHYDTSVFKL